MLVHVHGVAGIGKSWFLRHVEDELGRPYAHCDAAKQDPIGIMNMLATELSRFSSGFGDYFAIEERYHAALAKLGGDKSTPPALLTVLARSAVRSGGAALTMANPLAGAAYEVATESAPTQVSDWLLFLHSRIAKLADVQLVIDPLSQLSSAFLDGVTATSEEDLLLVIDTLEQAQTSTAEWLASLISGIYGGYPPKLGLLSASQTDLSASTWDDIRASTVEISLDVLTEEEIRDYLERVGATQDPNLRLARHHAASLCSWPCWHGVRLAHKPKAR